MLPDHRTSELFKPWRPTTYPSDYSTCCNDKYIELPSVSCYEELEADDAFQSIRDKFLADIGELKQLAVGYVGHQYDQAIDTFLTKLSTPPGHLKNSLLPLYRSVRFHIHRLVEMLREGHPDDSSNPSSPRGTHSQGKHSKEYVASVLHDCLNEIDLCPAGVHSRFASSCPSLYVSGEELESTLYKVRKSLFSEFLQSFLLQQKREGFIDISKGMEIHWFNSLHNLCCESLGLSLIDDPLAPTNLDDALTRCFLSEIPLRINACNILRSLAGQWSERMAETLHQLGESAWQTDPIEPASITFEKTEKLNSCVFKPINELLGTTGDNSLNFWSIVDIQSDGDYRLDRYREKLLAFATNHFCGSNTAVFAPLPDSTGVSKKYIGTIDMIYFWVFEYHERLHSTQRWAFDSNNHITLQLSHLKSIDFNSWSATTSQSLLTQAMAQTDGAEAIASFFLDHAVLQQLDHLSAPVITMLSNLLTEKMLSNDSDFKETLTRKVCDFLARSKPITAPTRKLQLLIDTPMLKPVLSELHQRKIDTFRLTDQISSWQIADLSPEIISKTLTPQNCRNLFRQALYLNQTTVLSRILLTGHCDLLINLSNRAKRPLIHILALSGNLAALQYLLKLPNVQPNHQGFNGWTPLQCAAVHGHWECVRELLNTKGIQVNLKTDREWSALSCAARYGHWKCVRELLKGPGIRVNDKVENNWTPLGLAAKHGHWQCVLELLKAEKILVNEKGSNGLFPLFCAAKNGHWRAVQALLSSEKILVNEKNFDDWTPLHSAVRSDHWQCVRELLTSADLLVNEKNRQGWAPLHCAVKHNHWECVRELVKSPSLLINQHSADLCPPLNTAARLGHWRCVRELMQSPDLLLNLKTSDGWTPLASAARNGHYKCIRELLHSEKTLVNETTNYGTTPLGNAAANGHHLCIQALSKAPGIAVNGKDKDGMTALNLATFYGHTQTVHELMQMEGIFVDEKNNADWTPLHFACRNGHEGCVQELLTSAEIDPNIRAPLKMKTALLLAIKFRNLECAKILIRDHRVNINKVDQTMRTALTEARKKRQHEIVSMLETDSRLNRHLDNLLRTIRTLPQKKPNY